MMAHIRLFSARVRGSVDFSFFLSFLLSSPMMLPWVSVKYLKGFLPWPCRDFQLATNHTAEIRQNTALKKKHCLKPSTSPFLKVFRYR